MITTCKTCGHVQIEPDSTDSDILTMVASYFNISVDQMKSKYRYREIVYPRQVAMYLLRKHKHHSLGYIGRMFNRDHTTVIHAMNTIRDLVYTDPKVRSDIKILSEAIK